MANNKDDIILEMMLLLIKEKFHLRSIARELQVHHSIIARKLKELIDNNVVDYKLEGKNKVFYIKKNIQARNYIYNAEGYKLIKLFRKYPELTVIAEDILKISKEKIIILFGSYAKFIPKKESDIDIYIETKDEKVKERIEHINSKIKVKIGTFNINDLLIIEIIKNHIILRGIEEFYEKNKFFV